MHHALCCEEKNITYRHSIYAQIQLDSSKKGMRIEDIMQAASITSALKADEGCFIQTVTFLRIIFVAAVVDILQVFIRLFVLFSLSVNRYTD